MLKQHKTTANETNEINNNIIAKKFKADCIFKEIPLDP